jgi:hypothetical protein
MKRRNYLSLLVFLLLGFHLPAQAQSIFGSIRGRAWPRLIFR